MNALSMSRTTAAVAVALVVLLAGLPGDAPARSTDGGKIQSATRDYIVRLDGPPLAVQVAAQRRQEHAVAQGATPGAASASTRSAAGGKLRAARTLDTTTPDAQAWLHRMDQELDTVRASVQARFGLEIQTRRRWR